MSSIRNFIQFILEAEKMKEGQGSWLPGDDLVFPLSLLIVAKVTSSSSSNNIYNNIL